MDLLRSYAENSDEDDESKDESLHEPRRNDEAAVAEEEKQEEEEEDPSSSPLRLSLPSKSSAPRVDDTALALSAAAVDRSLHRPIDPSQHSVSSFNPTYDQLWAPLYGPAHPYAKDGVAQGMRNHKLGFVEDASIQPFLFDEQYNTFHKFGYAADPSGLSFVGDLHTLDENRALSVYNVPQQEQKRRRLQMKGAESDQDPSAHAAGPDVDNPFPLPFSSFSSSFFFSPWQQPTNPMAAPLQNCSHANPFPLPFSFSSSFLSPEQQPSDEGDVVWERRRRRKKGEPSAT